MYIDIYIYMCEMLFIMPFMMNKCDESSHSTDVSKFYS